MAEVSKLVKACFSQFESLLKSKDLGEHTEEVPLQEWKDELGRLRVWAANIGAHQTGQSSLDYRLRDSSHINVQVVTLLERVQELIEDLFDVLEDQDDGEVQDNGIEIQGLEEISDDDNSTTEIQEIHQGLVETITQLYQMSMIIRQPAQHDRLVGTNKQDAEPFLFWARQHVSSKYPNADSLAIDRISSAMARQRAILKYRERHHAKLSQGIHGEDDEKSTILSQTVATNLMEEIPSQPSDMISEAGVSETSYGGTLIDGTGIDGPKVPPIPQKGLDQNPFECPYCFYIITVRDKRAWARHVFHDLMPYTCIFADCPTPQKLYEGRRQWYHHIRQVHAPMTSPNGIYDCTICKRKSLAAITFQRHVGQHLEELSLFFLPRTESNEEEDRDTDAEKHDSSVEDHSDASVGNGSLERISVQDEVMNNEIPLGFVHGDLRGHILEHPTKTKHYPSSVGESLSDRSYLGASEARMQKDERTSSGARQLPDNSLEADRHLLDLDNVDYDSNPDIRESQQEISLPPRNDTEAFGDRLNRVNTELSENMSRWHRDRDLNEATSRELKKVSAPSLANAIKQSQSVAENSVGETQQPRGLSERTSANNSKHGSDLPINQKIEDEIVMTEVEGITLGDGKGKAKMTQPAELEEAERRKRVFSKFEEWQIEQYEKEQERNVDTGPKRDFEEQFDRPSRTGNEIDQLSKKKLQERTTREKGDSEKIEGWIQKPQKEEDERENIRHKILQEEKTRSLEAEAREKAMKEAAIEEWKLEQERIGQKQKEEFRRKDKEFRARLRDEFGYTDAEIEQIFKKRREKQGVDNDKKSKKRQPSPNSSKTTWIKVHRKHLLPETLMAYDLPWDWDENDTNYLIIKKWLSEDFQEELFSHTSRLRERKMLIQTSNDTVKSTAREKDELHVVRKKKTPKSRIFI